MLTGQTVKEEFFQVLSLMSGLAHDIPQVPQIQKAYEIMLEFYAIAEEEAGKIRRIVFWPDGRWCLKKDLLKAMASGRRNNYRNLYIPADVGDSIVWVLINNHLHGAYDGGKGKWCGEWNPVSPADSQDLGMSHSDAMYEESLDGLPF